MRAAKTLSQLKSEYHPATRAGSTKRGYGYRWQRERKAFIHRNPLCAECLKEGRTEAAVVVDHIVPHKGDMQLFWDVSNWQGLCVPHHNTKTVKQDGGFGK